MRALPAVPTLLGVACLLALAVLAKLVHGQVGHVPLPLFTLGFSMSVGGLLRRHPRAAAWQPPLALPLSVGMILLGVQFDAALLAVVGPLDLVRLLGHWLVVGLVFWLVARVLRMEARTAGLLAVGLSGCGITAALAAADGDPLVRRDQRAGTVALTLLCGTLGFALMPPIAHALDMPSVQLARWAGLAMPTTAEAVLIGAAHCPSAMQQVGAYRFFVNVLQWIPILVYLRAFGPRVERAGPRAWSAFAGTVRSIPAFVWGLSFFGVFGFLGSFDAQERAILAHVTNWAFLASLVGIGIAMRPGSLVALGLLATIAGALAWSLAATLLPFWLRLS